MNISDYLQFLEPIQEQLDKGKQVLYLLPEIALTTQIIGRLRKHFGDKVGVFHSHMSNLERVEVWRAVKKKKSAKIQYSVVLGARSSLFLPFDNLGLIIIDEEHDSSYKQQQSSPRYHARDSAIYLANLYKAKVLLGSASPSLESYYNAKQGKYSLVDLNKRYGDMLLPEITVIDIRKAYLKKQMTSHFSPYLIEHIEKALERNKQIILFQNRRGYAPVLSCEACAYTPNCTACDISLTYHSFSSRLKCHYCGYTVEVPKQCTACNHKKFSTRGFGTQLIEEELKKIFPNANCQRMDYDTTRKKHAHQEIITILEKNGVKKINALNEKFDHNLHQAMVEIESDEESGTILKELQVGYIMNDRLVRPSMVAVSKKKDPDKDEKNTKN